jgi:hypothetical protein
MSTKPSWESYSTEEALKIPQLKHLAEALIRDAQNPQRGYRTKKYLKAQRSMTEVWVHQLREKHPGWQLKDILAEIVKGYPADMPSDVLLAMAQFIIETWEKAVMEVEVPA